MKEISKMKCVFITNLHIMHDIVDGWLNVDALRIVQLVDVQNVLHPIIRCNFDSVEDFADLT